MYVKILEAHLISLGLGHLSLSNATLQLHTSVTLTDMVAFQQNLTQPPRYFSLAAQQKVLHQLPHLVRELLLNNQTTFGQ
jgi:hypothetical protein